MAKRRHYSNKLFKSTKRYSARNIQAPPPSLVNYNKAESLFQEVLRIHRKVLGAEHPDTARTLNNLGDIYLVTGDYAKAASLFNQALEIMEKALGLTHPMIAQSLFQ